MSKLTVVTINLNYYKPGDDFFDHLEHDHDPEKALRAHSDQLKAVSEHLVRVADMVRGNEVTVDSDAHIISMTCDSKLANKLISEGLAEKAYEEEDVPEYEEGDEVHFDEENLEMEIDFD
jgi:hypothetical protein